LRNIIQVKPSIWKHRGGEPAAGANIEESRGFVRLTIEKADFSPGKRFIQIFA